MTRPPLEDARALGAAPRELAPGPAEPEPLSVLDAFRFALGARARRRGWGTGWLLVCVPIVGSIIYRGWLVEVARRLEQRSPQPLVPLRVADYGVHWRAGVAPYLLSHAARLGLVLVGGVSGTVVSLIALGTWLRAGWTSGLLALGVGLLLTLALLLFMAPRLAAAMAKLELGLPSTPQDARLTASFRRAPLLAHFTLSGAALLVGAALCGLGLVPAWCVVQLAGVHLRWQLLRRHEQQWGRLPALPLTPSVLPSERLAAARSAPARLPSP